MSHLAKLSSFTLPAARPFGLVSDSRVVAAHSPAIFNGVSPLRYRGLHLVTPGTCYQQKPDTLAQARRIVAQVEHEIQQQAAREAVNLENRWRAPIAPKPALPQPGFLDRLRHAVGF